jgi:hypothetical protein
MDPLEVGLGILILLLSYLGPLLRKLFLKQAQAEDWEQEQGAE